MADASNGQAEKKGGNKSLPLLIGGGVVIVALIVVIAVMAGKLNKAPEETPQEQDLTAARGVVVTKENAEQVAEDLFKVEYVETGYYNATMSTEWHFGDGTSVSEDAYVENNSANTNDVYFDVFLESDEEHAILSSPVIPRGQHWDEIKLDTPLDAGTYDCVMVYHLIDENQKTLSTLRVGLTIFVEK